MAQIHGTDRYQGWIHGTDRHHVWNTSGTMTRFRFVLSHAHFHDDGTNNCHCVPSNIVSVLSVPTNTISEMLKNKRWTFCSKSPVKLKFTVTIITLCLCLDVYNSLIWWVFVLRQYWVYWSWIIESIMLSSIHLQNTRWLVLTGILRKDMVMQQLKVFNFQ